jgi:hypothetical protein
MPNKWYQAIKVIKFYGMKYETVSGYQKCMSLDQFFVQTIVFPHGADSVLKNAESVIKTRNNYKIKYEILL